MHPEENKLDNESAQGRGETAANPMGWCQAVARYLLSLFVRVAEVHRHTPALLDFLDFLESERWIQLRALQLHSEGGDFLRLAESTGLEGFLILFHMPGDVEGVALAIAETVDDGAAYAALLADSLPQGLGFAPVTFKVLPLSDHQGLLAGGQYFFVQMLPPLWVVACAVFVGRWNCSCRTVFPGICYFNQGRHQKNR